MKAWPMVALGDIAPIIRRPVEIDTATRYREIGARSFGKGLFIKPDFEGADATWQKPVWIKAGDVVLSNIKAWEGAIALARNEHDGCIASHRYITCVPDSARLTAGFLVYYLLSEDGLEKVVVASPGTADRNRTLGTQKLSQIKVPLPPLAEQQAIVARLDALAEKTRQVESHLDAVASILSALLLSLHHKLAGERSLRLGDVLELCEYPEVVTPAGTYPQVGVRGFGGGLFPKAAISGAETSYRAFNRLYTGAIVLSQVKGWEGAIARCPEELDEMFASPEYRTFKCKPGMANDEYLGELVKTEWFWSQLQEATRGVGARRERTRPEQFLNVEIPFPQLEDQCRILAIMKQKIKLLAKHAAIREANAALLSATLERVFSLETLGKEK